MSFYLCFKSNDKDRMTQIALIAHSERTPPWEKHMNEEWMCG